MPDATLTQPSNAAPPAPPAGKPKKPASKKQMRRIAIASVTAAALAVGGYFLYRFLTKNDSAGAEMQTVVADYGSIQSKASGSGNAKAKENKVISTKPTLTDLKNAQKKIVKIKGRIGKIA